MYFLIKHFSVASVHSVVQRILNLSFGKLKTLSLSKADKHQFSLVNIKMALVSV